MENVAESLATNAKVAIEIANLQKTVSELQNRAYLSIVFLGVVPQNRETGYRYEPRYAIVNNGHTPAHDVRFEVGADICAFPLPSDFSYPLSGIRSSPSIIGPQQNKMFSAALPRLYSDEEDRALKDGVTQRIYVWGVIYYRDAFQIDRHIQFCQTIIWLADRVSPMSLDTGSYNEAT